MKKSTFPQAVKAALWSYDADKMSLSNPDHMFIIIINILNRGTDAAVDWLLGNVSTKEIKETIKKSYVSEWNKSSLKFWADFFKVCPKWKNRMEYILRNDREKDKILATINDNLWPYGGNVWEEIKKYRE